MKKSFSSILKEMRILLLATSIFFGGGATLDIVHEGISDVQSIERQIGYQNNSQKDYSNYNENNGLEGAGKGAISMLSLFLYFYAQNSQNKKTSQTFNSIQINIPFEMNKGNMSDEELSHYFQIHKEGFIKLIKNKLPDYFHNVCQIDQLEIKVKGNYLYVYVELKITTIEGFEDFVKLIKKVVNDTCHDLFLEKLDRVKRKLNLNDFSETVSAVVNEQLKEAKLI